MSQPNQQSESRVLLFSSALAGAFAIGGLAVGLLLGSIVIAFDGLYSLVSLLLTLLSLAAAKYIHAPRDEHFPKGRAVLEPIVIAIKGATILGVVSFSIVSSINALFNGGVELNIGVASAFGIINIAGCAFAWWQICRMSRKQHSGLIEAEAKQWQMDTLLSVAVTAGFFSAWGLLKLGYSEAAMYADPVMMLLIAGYFIKVPLEMVVDSVRELLQMAPKKELVNKVEQSVDKLCDNAEVEQTVELRSVVKVGHELRVDLDVIPDANKPLATKDLTTIKRNLRKSLDKVPLDVKLTLSVAV